MLTLVRNGNDVFCDGKKLTINAQASKGPNKEVVKIDGLEGSNGQKWVSLSLLEEGENQIATKGREVTSTQSYTLTPEETAKVNDLKAQIAEIVDAAKARYVAKPKLDVDPTKMTEAQRLAKIEELKKFYNLK